MLEVFGDSAENQLRTRKRSAIETDSSGVTHDSPSFQMRKSMEFPSPFTVTRETSF